MQKNMVTPIHKNITEFISAKLASTKFWAATAACLVLSATLLPVAGSGRPVTSGSVIGEAENYTCTSTCYDRYYTCIYSGQSSTYCQSQLSFCLTNCGGTASPTQ